MGKTGRNEKCPCGSGRKYKHCCGAENNIIPFPGNTDFTWQETQGSPNLATDILQKLKQDIGNREFDSEADLQSYVSDWQQKQTDAPVDDFLGLSPGQMSGILNRPLEEQSDFLCLKPILTASDIPDIPLLNQSLWLLGFLKDSGPLKLTAAGYLPPAAACTWFHESFTPYLDAGTVKIINFRREADYAAMYRCREILKDLKWTTQRKGILSLSAKGREAMAMDINSIYRVLFYHLADERDWETRDEYRFPLDPFLQRSLGFYLYLLHKGVHEGIKYRDLAEYYYRAFPHHYAGIEDDIVVYLDVAITPSRNFTDPLGLTSTVQNDRDWDSLAPTALFGRILDWV